MAYLTEKKCLFVGEKVVTLHVKMKSFVKMNVRVSFGLRVSFVTTAG
jgi:hypothetical protein